jgi:hypothetical protein
MSNAIYAPRLEYISLSDNPEMELSNAIKMTFHDESICKCFGYLFEEFDRHRMVFVVNGTIFEMDVLIRDKEVTIIKGAFNDIKMYLVARVSKLLNVVVPYNAFEYIERRILTILNTPFPIDFINISLEISHMKLILKKMMCCTNDILNNFRVNIRRFRLNHIMKEEMSDPCGLGVNLSQYLATVTIREFALDISRLYLVHYLLEFPNLNEVAKSYCRIVLLEHHHINYDRYEDVTYDVAEWIYNKHFNEPFIKDALKLDKLNMDEVD